MDARTQRGGGLEALSRRAMRLAGTLGMLLLAAGTPVAALKGEPCGIITTVAGGGGDPANLGDGGPARQAYFHGPFGVAVGPESDLYVADTYNHRIRRIDRDTGIVRTIAGWNWFGNYSGDGGPATEAELNRPYAIVFDAQGNLFFTDTGNSRIRRIDRESGIISTVAGDGQTRFVGDGLLATQASLGPAYGLTFGPEGALYVSDTGNNRVRRIDPDTGIIQTVAGGGGTLSADYGDEGPATEAQLSIPYGIVFDSSGDLFISDTGHGRVRRVDADTGMITTIAGVGPIEAHHVGHVVRSVPVPIPGSGIPFGDGGSARRAILSKTRTIVADPQGNLFVADSSISRIWRIDRDNGVITSIAGNGSDGYSGDGGPAYKAAVWDPLGLAMDAQGNLYIADSSNGRIRKVTPPFCSEELPPR